MCSNSLLGARRLPCSACTLHTSLLAKEFTLVSRVEKYAWISFMNTKLLEQKHRTEVEKECQAREVANVRQQQQQELSS